MKSSTAILVAALILAAAILFSAEYLALSFTAHGFQSNIPVRVRLGVPVFGFVCIAALVYLRIWRVPGKSIDDLPGK